jgi:peptidoglycan/xylan/chitin deacetylase (PgdA/CDA1 family)
VEEQNRRTGSVARKQPYERTLAILAYHKIGEPSPGGWDTWFYVPESVFARHLQFLKKNGWTIIDRVTFLRSLDEPDRLPERAALLTFDDGYRSMREVALPVLLRSGYPSVLFVPTDYVGGRNWFDADNEPDEAICDWDDLRELERCNVSVQSHGTSHRAFSDLTVPEQEEELRRSKSLIEQRLDRTVDIFSYPYGDCGVDPGGVRQAMTVVGYRAAFLYVGGPVRLPISDPYRVTRIAMGPDTDLHAELGSV